MTPQTLRDRAHQMRCETTDDGATAEMLESAAEEIERLRYAATRAAEIIDRNLSHQREKVKDASTLLKQSLNPPF